MSLANGSLITSFTQYLSGGNYRSEWYASNGSSNRIIELGYNDFKIKYLENADISHEVAFVMVDSTTGEFRRKSPADFTGLYGDNWGSQVTSVTSPITGNGTSGSPLGLGTVPISKGGTGLTSVGANATILGSDGSAALWLTPTVTSLTSAAAFSRSGSNLRLNLPDASTSVRGLVTSSGTQILGGDKIFSGSLSAFSGFFGMASPTLAAIFASGVHGSSYAVISSDSVLGETHNFIAVDALSTGITIGLPDCNSIRNGWEYRFVKIGADAYAATIDPISTQEFTDGDGTKPLSGQYSSATCKCQWDGASGTWFYVPAISPTSGILTAGNGLYKSGTTVKLGTNPLTENTAIDADGYTLDITNSDAITFSATGIFGITSTLSVNSLNSEIQVVSGSTRSVIGGNGAGSAYIAHENTATAATARIIAEDNRKAALQYIPTGGATSLEYFVDGGADVQGHYQKGIRYKSTGDTVLVTDATTGEVRKRAASSFGYISTASNGLTKSGSNVKMGGPLVENTTISGASTYALTMDSMYTLTAKARRTSGTGASDLFLSSALGVNTKLTHFDPASPASVSGLYLDYHAGNSYIISDASNGLSRVTQYLDAGAYNTRIQSYNGDFSQSKSINVYPDRIEMRNLPKSASDSVALMVYDTINKTVKYQSPNLFPVSAFTGEMKIIAVATTPVGWLTCDGSAVSRTTYAGLFSVIGTAFGVGDGSATFNLPDMRDRFPVGAGTTYAVGATGGAATVTLSSGNLPSHTHTVSIPAATGGTLNNEPDSGKILGPASIYTPAANQDENLSPFNTGSAGSGTAVDIVPKYAAVRYIICWRGKTP